MRLAVRRPAARRRMADEPAIVFRHAAVIMVTVASAADQAGSLRRRPAAGEAR
jgi:hypothetical protein